MALYQAQKMSARLCSLFDIVAKDFSLLTYIMKEAAFKHLVFLGVTFPVR